MFLCEFDNLVSSHLAYHDSLNPKFWDDNNMLRPEIREALLRIAEEFEKDLDLDSMDVQDIVLTGSIVNYNWTKYSDIDLHLVTDLDVYSDPELAEKYFNAKRNLWNRVHDIEIHDTDVEVYVEDNDDPPESKGRYSVMNDEWLSEPSYDPPTINDREVNQKAEDLMRQIDRLLNSDPTDPNDITRFKEKIWKMRRAGLEKDGENSVENLVFKILRNSGYLDKILKAENKTIDQSLSL